MLGDRVKKRTAHIRNTMVGKSDFDKAVVIILEKFYTNFTKNWKKFNDVSSSLQ